MSEANISELEAGSVEDIVSQLDRMGAGDMTGETDVSNDVDHDDDLEGGELVSDNDEVEGSDELEGEAEEAEVEGETPDDQMVTYENAEGESVSDSLSDLIESKGRVTALEAEITELKTAAETMNPQVKQLVAEQQGRLADLIQMTETMNMYMNQNGETVPEVDRSLLDTDPLAYQDALIKRDAEVKGKSDMKQTLETLYQQQNDNLRIQQESYLKEQVGLVNDFWPELGGNKDVYPKIETLLSEYGFNKDEVSQIADSRYYRIVKDLMGFKETKNKSTDNAKKVLKAVINNPKLTKRGAKAPTKSKDLKAMDRLKQTGSDEDAVRALKAMGF